MTGNKDTETDNITDTETQQDQDKSEKIRYVYVRQTKLESLIEVCTNTSMAMLWSLIAQLIIFPLLGIEVTLGENFILLIFFTAVSFVRQYVNRRIFNNLTKFKRGVRKVLSCLLFKKS